MKKHTGLLLFSVLFTSICIWGCATLSVMVEPTAEEMKAASKYRKSVAIISVSEEGSDIIGVSSLVQSKLEKAYMAQFNLIEAQKIADILKEKDLDIKGGIDKASTIGRTLGVDYLVFANAVVTFSGPEIGNYESERDGKFYGKIWEKYTTLVEVSVKMVDVHTGIVAYADQQKGYINKSANNEFFTDKQIFRETLKHRLISDMVKRSIGNLSNMTTDKSYMISNAIYQATESFRDDIRKKFIQDGEIIKIISDTEVMVNLGSAYGISIGDSFIIYNEDDQIKDPKTGTIVASKSEKCTLRVTKVTSGLTCIAKSSVSDISKLKVGDKVFTN